MLYKHQQKGLNIVYIVWGKKRWKKKKKSTGQTHPILLQLAGQTGRAMRVANINLPCQK